ncbi:hypothetical protein BDF19DRAFT_251066 [Syncephalis fuscata]|nr:hypothetical protein BDF19DRAFT_251066 [Syncephalis fuscata]
MSDYNQNDATMYSGPIKTETQSGPMPVALSNGYSHVYPQAASMQQVQNYMVQSQPPLNMQPLQGTTYVASPGGTSITATMAPNSYSYMTVYPTHPATQNSQPIYPSAQNMPYTTADSLPQLVTTQTHNTAIPSYEPMKETHPLTLLSQSLSPPMPIKPMQEDEEEQLQFTAMTSNTGASVINNDNTMATTSTTTAEAMVAAAAAALPDLQENANAAGKISRSLNINVAAANADTSTPLPTFAKKLGELPPTGHRSPHILKKPAGLSVHIPERPNSGSHLAGGTNANNMQFDYSPSNESFEDNADVEMQGGNNNSHGGRARHASMSRRLSGLSRSTDLTNTTMGKDMRSSAMATGVATAGSEAPEITGPNNVNDMTSSRESTEDPAKMDPLQCTLYEAFENDAHKKTDAMNTMANTAGATTLEDGPSMPLISSISGTSMGGRSSNTAQDSNINSALPSKFARDLPSPSAFYREIYQQGNDVPSPFPSFNTPTPKSGTGGSFNWPAPMTRGPSGGNNMAGSSSSGNNSGSSNNGGMVHHPSPLKQSDSVSTDDLDIMNSISINRLPTRSRTPLANSITGSDNGQDMDEMDTSRKPPATSTAYAPSMMTPSSSLTSTATSNTNTTATSLLHATVRTASELTPTTEAPTAKRLRAE